MSAATAPNALPSNLFHKAEHMTNLSMLSCRRKPAARRLAISYDENRVRVRAIDTWRPVAEVVHGILAEISVRRRNADTDQG